MAYRVMIVDDSKLARMSVAKILNLLEPSWLRVEASNADEAIGRMNQAASEQNPIDIVLLDFNMPGRDGLALAAELRALNPAMPLGIITANIQDEIVARARAVGAAFLAKPVTQQALAEFLAGARRHLGLSTQ